MACSYDVKITFVRVPDALKEVPLPVEIISQAGEATRCTFTMGENGSEIVPVKAAGSYLVRIELPSGRMIAETAVVSETTEASAEASGEVTVDFGFEESTAVDTFDQQPTFGWRREEKQRLIFQTSDKFLPSRVGAVKEPPTFRRLMRAAMSFKKPVSIEYGLFVGWSPNVPEDIGETPVYALVIEQIDTISTDLPGNINLQQHPGWAGSSRQWRPLLLRARFPSSEFDFRSAEALLIWPPSRVPLPLTLLSDSHPEVNADAPPLLAFWPSEDPAADALFSFIRRGALDAARRASPILVERATNLLSWKIENPVNAILAAYTLLKISNTERQEWVANLANWFECLADGAVIYGWYLIRAGEADKSRKYFRMALARGVPMYSEGVRLLRDGLNFLQELYPEDTQLRADARRARTIAAAANLDSELTCVRLERGLEVRFVKTSLGQKLKSTRSDEEAILGSTPQPV